MKQLFRIIIVLIIIGLIIIGYLCFFGNNKGNSNSVFMDTGSDEALSADLFGDYYDEALDEMKNMTMEEKVGQLFLVRYSYDDVVLDEVSTLYTGGYILFARDFDNETVDSIKEKMDKLQSSSKIPLTLAVDEEGGTVTRISRFTNFRNSKFEAPRDVYNQGGYDLLEQIEKEKAELLKSVGMNLNLAPDADVSTDENDFIYNRSFRDNAEATSEYITNMVTYANSNGISSCLKHFPGYGNNVDTHTGIAIDNRSKENFETSDLLPFEAGIKANVPAILVEHTIVDAYDSNYPASISKNVHDLLRNDLAYSGIIMTDDLAMDAVKIYVEDGKAATLAINAGNDMIITSSFKEMYDEVLASVKDGTISKKTINTAVKRIIAWKYAYGLF